MNKSIIDNSLGVDIENINRFKNIALNKKFLSKIYTTKELAYCLNKKKPSQHLAVRYCAKEAVIKACNARNIDIKEYNQIEILNKKNGVPYINIIKREIQHKVNINISLSHCKDIAIAFAIISTKIEVKKEHKDKNKKTKNNKNNKPKNK